MCFHYLHRFVESFKPATHVTRVCKTSLHDWSTRVVIVRKTTRGRTAFVVNLKPMRSFEKYSPYLACPSLCSFGPGHGLRTPRESFFSKIPNFWAWADKLGRKFGGHLGYFPPNYQHIMHVFHYSTIISTKN